MNRVLFAFLLSAERALPRLWKKEKAARVGAALLKVNCCGILHHRFFLDAVISFLARLNDVLEALLQAIHCQGDFVS